jgi:hypothetical protein
MASIAGLLFRDRWRITITVAGLLGSFALFQFTELDLWVQDHFYDFQTRAWLVDKKAGFPRMVFYTGPKVVIIRWGGDSHAGLPAESAAARVPRPERSFVVR